MTLAATIPASRPRLVAAGCGVAFICYAAASITWSQGNQLYASILLISLVTAFLLGAILKSIERVWFWFCVLLTLNLIVGLIEWYGFDFPGYGLAGNPNYFGCALVLGLAAAVIYRILWFIPIAVGGLLFCQSRAAFFAAGVIGILSLWRSYRGIAIISMLLAILAIVTIRTDNLRSFEARMGIWQDTINHLTILGSGFGSFSDIYASWEFRRSPMLILAPHAYNDFLELIFELGIGAIFLWVFVIHTVSESRSNTKLIIYTYTAMALSFFPLWITPIGSLVALTLGHLWRETSGSN